MNASSIIHLNVTDSYHMVSKKHSEKYMLIQMKMVGGNEGPAKLLAYA